MKVRSSELLNSLPQEWPEPLLPCIAASVRRSHMKIVVLDDDPTGTQTVHGVPVLTEWSIDSLAELLVESGEIAYILTNSRSLCAGSARALSSTIAKNLLCAAQIANRQFVVVSRSDSTLRGHYPDEVEGFIDGLGQSFDGILIIPCFMEGGRFTIRDIHYVREGEWLVPAAETEYAWDASFGYSSSNLREWVSEKHGGRILPDSVASISIEELRHGGPEAVAHRLKALAGGQVCVLNAASYRDLEVFVSGLLMAEAQGKRFFYRTAASFVRIRGGLEARPLLTSCDLGAECETAAGGLIVAGSYVQRSTLQIASVQSLARICCLEVPVEDILNRDKRDREIQRIAAEANQAIITGKDVLVYTSRRLAAGQDAEEALRIGNIVSDSLVEIVRRIDERPAWVVAKGGVTSSDIATKALGIRRARVLGQAYPGVPVWLAGKDSRWPELIYTVFPGNVGEADTLAKVVLTLRNGKQN
jgi:uncharacterized protein YgbK (DUF1537 family)